MQEQSFVWAADSNIKSYVWSGNSAYDPDYSGVGTYSYLFPQLCGSNAPYQKYLVYGSKVRVTLVTTGTGSTPEDLNFRANLFPTWTSSGPATWQNQLNMPWARERLCLLGKGSPLIKSWATTAQVFGVRPGTVTDNPNYSGDYGSDPANEWLWGYQMQPCCPSSTLHNNNNCRVQIQVKITYYVCFYRRSVILQQTIA